MAGDLNTRKVDTCSRFVGRDFSACELRQQGVKQLYLNFFPDGESGKTESIRSVYERIGASLAALGGEIVNERCYAETNRYGEVCEARAEAYSRWGLEHNGTLSFVGGCPAAGGELAGVQIWAVVAESAPAVQTMVVGKQPVGRKLTAAGVSYLSVASVCPLPDAVDTRNRREQARSMFHQADRILRECGFGYRDVARTWIYLPRLLRWYDEFNAVRREVYRELGLYRGSTPVWLPASTGIQGRGPEGHECTMDLLAVSSSPHVKMRMLHSPLQGEAFDYGSFFCRAVELNDGSSSRIYVSGTASIGCDGATAFKWDPKAQIRFTLQVVEELIGSCGHGFANVAHCVAFVKKPGYVDFVRERACERGLDPRLVVQAGADVCREDLEFEMEALTVKSVNNVADSRNP